MRASLVLGLLLSSSVAAPVFASEPDVTAPEEPAASGEPAAAAAAPSAEAQLPKTKQELPRNVALSSQGEVVVKQTAQLPVGAASSMIPVQTVLVKSGRAEATLPHQTLERGVILQGPDGILGLSTHGKLTLIVQDAAVVIVASGGDAMVGIGGRFRPLPDGTVRVVDRKTKQGSDSPLLAAPSVAPVARMHVVLDGELSLPLRITPVEGARTYRVQVTSADGERRLDCPSPTDCRLAVASAGSYRVAVEAIDALGLEGRSSPEITFRTLALTSPETHVVEGSLHLEPGERAEFAGTEGLLARYGNAPDTAPATALVGLSGRKPTSIHFIDPAAPTDYAVVPLLPRVLTTRIDIGPSRVVWPEQKVHVRVDVRDLRGTPSDTSGFDAAVTVNSKPIQLAWSRGAGTLEGDVAPQVGPGPWVVRVRVKNQRGIEVARNFLEVIESPRLETASR